MCGDRRATKERIAKGKDTTQTARPLHGSPNAALPLAQHDERRCSVLAHRSSHATVAGCIQGAIPHAEPFTDIPVDSYTYTAPLKLDGSQWPCHVGTLLDLLHPPEGSCDVF
jgi:hypothetical protein